jgi:hypothetical protein
LVENVFYRGLPSELVGHLTNGGARRFGRGTPDEHDRAIASAEHVREAAERGRLALERKEQREIRRDV